MRKSQRSVKHQYVSKTKVCNLIVSIRILTVYFQVTMPAAAAAAALSEIQEEDVQPGSAGNVSAGNNADGAKVAPPGQVHSAGASLHPLHLFKVKADAEDHSNWAAQYKECPACLIPLTYVSENLELRKKHMVACDGANLDAMFDPVCPKRAACDNRDVVHWATVFH